MVVMCIECLNTSSAKNSHPLRVLETEWMQYAASQELWPLGRRLCNGSAAMEIGAITSCNEGPNGPNCHHHRMKPRDLSLSLSPPLPRWICADKIAARNRASLAITILVLQTGCPMSQALQEPAPRHSDQLPHIETRCSGNHSALERYSSI